MDSIKLHTVRGHITIVSPHTLKYTVDDNGRYIELSPNSGYYLEVYTNNGVFARINTVGSLTDPNGQQVFVGFILQSDMDYCSPAIVFRIGYKNYDE